MAQHSLSMGIRQGVGVWFTKTGVGKGSLQFAEGDHFSWNKELFFRQQLDKKWAYEVSLMNYQLHSIHTDQSDYKTIKTEKDAQFLESSLSIQYDVTYPLAGYMVPALKDMKSYIGFALAQRFSFEQVNATTFNNDASVHTNAYPANNFNMFVGFNYTHIIPISKRINITSVFAFKMNPFSQKGFRSIDYSNPNRVLSISSGISYKL